MSFVCFGLPLLAAWLVFCLIGIEAGHRFRTLVAPARLDAWAEAEGLRIESSERRTLRGWFVPFGPSIGGHFVIFRVVVSGPDGRREAWVRVGAGWLPSTTAEGCPIAVRWMHLPAPEHPSPGAAAMHDPDLDGP